jgi:hypothetical protein
MRGLRQQLRTLGKQRKAVPAPLPLVIRRGRREVAERRSAFDTCELRIKRLTPDGEVFEWIVPTASCDG